jgi:hypothetical protein
MHPSEPLEYLTDPEFTPPPRRVRTRPSRRYESPEEAWSWHWARMRIVAAWTVLLTVSVICSITAITFLLEML